MSKPKEGEAPQAETKAPETDAPETPEGQGEGVTTPRVTVDLTQDELDKLIGAKIADARAKAEDEAAKKAEADRKAAQEQSLIEQKQYEELATARGTEIETLTASKATLEAENANLKQRLEKAEGALNKQLETVTANIPAGVKKLLDAMSPAERLDWLAENAKDFAKDDGGEPGDRTNGGRGILPPSPDSKQQPKKLTRDEKLKQSVSASSYA